MKVIKELYKRLYNHGLTLYVARLQLVSYNNMKPIVEKRIRAFGFDNKCYAENVVGLNKEDLEIVFNEIKQSKTKKGGRK